MLAAAYRATARGGTTVAIGLPHPSRELTLNALSLVAESRTLQGLLPRLGRAAARHPTPDLALAGRDGCRSSGCGETRSALDGLNGALDALADGAVVRQIVVP